MIARYLDRAPVGEWAKDAACAGMDPNLFVPSTGVSYRKARAVCAGCPVAAECLQHAMANCELQGFWGGTTPRERFRLGMRRVALIERSPRCGSDSAYRRHLRFGESPCDACKAAHVESNRQRKTA